MAIDPDDFQRVCASFEAALLLPVAERSGFVDTAFRDEPDLREELLRMLAAHDAEPEFLKTPGAQTLAATELATAVVLNPGDRVGDFELVRPLGSGGMGLVWEATQLEPRRTVALKTMRAGLGSELDARRFREESRLLARLSHPGIAQILAAGVLDAGLPWFAMEFVNGAQSIDRYARPLGTVEKLSLFLQVCDAVSHGHLRGVVHRDLKPDNLLVDADGRVKVIDFGIARATEAEQSLTVDGAVMGTLPYMAPEQVEGDRESIDVRTDVHALGAVLFALMGGRSPWPVDESFGALARRILHDDPPRLSALVPGLSRELDWIVAMAMAKEPARRYQSAAELAADVRRLLGHEPLVAGPPSATYRARKFVRRHTVLVTAFALLVLGAIGTVFGLVRALDKQAEAEAARVEVEETAARLRAQNRYLEDMLGAPDPFGVFSAGREMTVAQMLDSASEKISRAFPERPDLEAATRLLIGSTYRGQGRYDEATQHLEAGLRIYRQVHGGDHVDTARALRLLSVVHAVQGRHEQALTMLRESLAMLEALGVDDIERVRTHGGFAVALLRLRRADEAEQHAKAALELARDLGHETSETAAILRMNMAQILRLRGDNEGAEQNYRECVAMFEEVLEPGHPNVALAQNNLGFLLHDVGRSAEAVPILEAAVAALRPSLDGAHPKLADACLNLSNAYAGSGNQQGGESLGREAVAMYRETLGTGHPDYANAINSLAYLFCEASQWDKAEAEFRRLVEFYRALDPGHARVTLNRAYAAECVGYGDLNRARQELAELYEDRAAILGRDDDVVQAVVRCVVRLCEHHEDSDGLALWRPRLRTD